MSVTQGHVRIQNLSLHLGQAKNRFQALDRLISKYNRASLYVYLAHLVAVNQHY